MKLKLLHKKILGHTWDETLVIAVMITAALCVLILLANHISVTGQAFASTVPSNEGLITMLSQGEVLEGNGKMKCESGVGCGKIGKTCVLAKVDNKLASCDKIISGDYYCVCASPQRIS